MIVFTVVFSRCHTDQTGAIIADAYPEDFEPFGFDPAFMPD